MWLSLVHPLLGTWPATQACALTGDQTGNPLLHRLVLNPLTYTSHGTMKLVLKVMALLPPGVAAWIHGYEESFGFLPWVPRSLTAVARVLTFSWAHQQNNFLPAWVRLLVLVFHTRVVCMLGRVVSPEAASSISW